MTTRTPSPASIGALPLSMSDLSEFEWSRLLLLAATEAEPDALGMEQRAFTDDIALWDTPIQIMVGLFGVVVLGLAGLSFVSAQVDAAITQTLRDFESVLRRDFAAKEKA